jgi:ribose transport system permease protein
MSERSRTALATVRDRLANVGAAPTWLPPLVILVVLTVVVESLGPGFLSPEMIGIKIGTVLTLLLVATGQTIVMLRGGIDLSVGGTLSLATAIAATRADTGFVALLPWLAVILGTGILVGVVNGLLVTHLEIQPFLVTLATWSMAEGAALMILPSEGGTVPAVWFKLGYGAVAGIPTTTLAFVVLLVWWLWFRGTRLAQTIVATGSSERGAYLNRVSIARTNLVVYGLAGFFAALAGIAYATQTGAGSPTVGAEYVLPAIAAVVIGGTSLSGGRGGLMGTIIGALILNLIADAVFLLHLKSYWQPLASGVILVLAVAIGQFGAGRRGGTEMLV